MSVDSNIPHHVAIIMDGNGRWAQSRGKERLYGHTHGVESVRKAIMECRRLGVRYLTLYVFSTQNWTRPQQEVEGLMELLCESILNETKTLVENQVKVSIIGDREAMPDKVQDHLKIIEQQTAECNELTVLLALNYGAREEITLAAKDIAKKVAKGDITPDEVNLDLFNNCLHTAGIPDPDLLIRTSGEHRLSNFLLWQLAYTEFYFTETLWPDFDEEELRKALDCYATRERRYGGVKNNSDSSLCF